VTNRTEWNDHHYNVGDIIPLPYNPATDSLDIPIALKGSVQLLRDTTTSRPVRPSAAWISIEQTIMRDADFGRLIRSIHGYAAGMLIASMFIHLCTAMLMRAYRRPRQWIWYSGVILLLLLLASGFTGSLLPWNTLSYAAARVGISYPEESLPLAGSFIAEMIRGGEDVGAMTLTRAYAAHVIVLPLAILLVVGLHAGLVHRIGIKRQESIPQQGGMTVASALGGSSVVALVLYAILADDFDPSSPYVIVPLLMLAVSTASLLSTLAEGGEQRADTPFYRHAIFREMIAWTILLGIILTIALMAPWGEAEMPVDLTLPLPTPQGVQPEWYLLWAYRLLTILPGGLAMGVMALAFVFLLLLPSIDRSAGRRHPAITLLGVAMIAAAVILTLLD
jgi:quinol-cytochrome oxidoreductase complex cytochrome b subunit